MVETQHRSLERRDIPTLNRVEDQHAATVGVPQLVSTTSAVSGVRLPDHSHPFLERTLQSFLFAHDRSELPNFSADDRPLKHQLLIIGISKATRTIR